MNNTIDTCSQIPFSNKLTVVRHAMLPRVAQDLGHKGLEHLARLAKVAHVPVDPHVGQQDQRVGLVAEDKVEAVEVLEDGGGELAGLDRRVGGGGEGVVEAAIAAVDLDGEDVAVLGLLWLIREREKIVE